MDGITNNIKFVIAWLALFLTGGTLLASVYPVSDPGGKECPATLIFLLIFLSPFLAAKLFPLRPRTHAGKIMYVFCKFSVVLFCSLGILLETGTILFGEDIPIVFSVLELISPFFIAYFACNKRSFSLKKLSGPEKTGGEPSTDGACNTQPDGHHDIENEMARIDAMNGQEFEYFTAGLLRKLGYQNVEVTSGSGDQGVDVFAEKDGIRYAFQCKCYTSDLGNKPVQEVNTGKSIYRCHVGVVITNRYFTRGAKEAAEATGTLLWDRDKLQLLLASAV